MVTVELTEEGIVLKVNGEEATGAEARQYVQPGDVERLVKQTREFDSPYAATFALGVHQLLTGATHE